MIVNPDAFNWIDICSADFVTFSERFVAEKRSNSVFFEKRLKKNRSVLADNKIKRIFADLLR